MSKQLMMILIFCLLLSTSCAAGEDTPVEDSLLLSLVLQRSFEDGGYTVVSPQTKIFIDVNDPEEVEETKEYILESLKMEGRNIRKLVDLLFERNKTPVRLPLESSPEDGYLIDDEGKFINYFLEEDGDGWEKWRLENPKAHCMTSVSLPAYDTKTNVFVIYIGTQCDWLAGVGWVIAFKYENDQLSELGRVALWVS